MGPSFIIVRGAREHNLKDIDVRIPRDRFVVITGLSGSGKSTLAFDTIYAEGQRRYVESLSAYARQFLEQMNKPDVDVIDGLSPAISIEQKATSRNPRSTVGTVTEIYDYYRLLFARIGVPHCYRCSKPIQAQTVTQMVDRLNTLPEGTKVAILAPITRNRKGEFAKELKELRKAGFVRVRIDGAVQELADEIALDKKKKHTIDLFVDRLVIRPTLGNRLADSLETALRYGQGIAQVEWGEEAFLLSEKSACIECGISYPEITPQMFSFNNPTGACPDCTGLGTKMYFDPDLIVPNKLLSLREGAIAPWHSTTSTYYHQVFENLARHYRFSIQTPWEELPDPIRAMLLAGSGAEEIRFAIDRHGRRETYTNPFRGVIPLLEQRYNETASEWIREDIERYMNVRPCPACKGARLRMESRHIKVQGRSIAELVTLSVAATLDAIAGWTLASRDAQVAERIVKEIVSRLRFLHNVGLGYLTLDRAAATLSGGEGQRIRLATQIGSALTGVLYVLDEPSIGLHQRDNHRLLETLTRLRDLGNTVLVVEHDHDTICAADHVIDMGPGAGVHGGYVVATGSPREIMENTASLTGQYLAGKQTIPVPRVRHARDGRMLAIRKARQHNLQGIDVAFPVGCFTCVTGVSGSGKSTLVNTTLYPALCQRLYRSKIVAGACDGIEGAEHFDKVINIDQTPIGRTPRSNPATYTGVFGHIRDLFAELPVAKARGYKPGRFSFNVKGGRCEACEGDGILRIEMQFLPDVFVECEVCRGKRFNRETLEIQYKGMTIADVLAMTAEQAAGFFAAIPAIRQKVQTLIDVGLGYIALGQSATTLSGGEAQRIKLSRELAKRATGRTLYILDEPTTGLHFADIARLLEVLTRLRDAGNTLVVIEHNLDVIKSADYVIDLGPEGGDAGGRIVGIGTPEDLTRLPGSYTGQYLTYVLSRDATLVSPHRPVASATS
ncbi:MAG: excinuclease ABC subunit UvrA [Deltaproteobacteria bacterium]|nr:excinuclease ABC subunit UvrA [Deltaproteobacteria bacterium]